MKTRILRITIKMDNAAFEDSNGTEAARILRRLADDIDGLNWTESSQSLFDLNGNKVGRAEVN